MASPRISEQVWRERVAQWRDSGLVLQAFAEQSGYTLARLTYWSRRLEREAAQPMQLLPVRVARPAPVPAVELRSPSGWTLRVGAGCEPAWLVAVLAGLR